MQHETCNSHTLYNSTAVIQTDQRFHIQISTQVGYLNIIIACSG